jgi:hypothetical protein
MWPVDRTVLYRYGLSLYTGWGPVDRNFCHVDLVNRTFVPVNRPNWHFEMACMLLMIHARNISSAVLYLLERGKVGVKSTIFGERRRCRI